MATERLLIQIDEKGARVVKRNIEDIGRSAGGADAAVGFLKRGLATLASVAIVREIISMADSFTNMQNRIRLVTNSTEELTSVTRELLNISQSTRTSLETNAELFNRLANATKDLDVSQAELLQITKSLNQAVIISGASSTEAAAGLLQLSQGLASGALRGDELRSVLEQLPAVADVIANKLGVTRGALRQLGSDGKITAEIVLDAFRAARGELEDKFAKTVPTVEQAFTQLKNQVIATIGEVNNATGATSSLSGVLQSVTQFIAEITPQLINFGRALSGTLDPSDELNSNVQVFASILVVAAGAVDILASTLVKTLGAAFRTSGKLLGGFAAAIEAALSGDLKQAKRVINETFDDVGTDVSETFTSLKDELVTSSTDTITQLKQIWDPGAREVRQLQESVAKPIDAPKIKLPAVDEKALARQEEFIRGLQQQATELAIQVAEGDKADATLTRYQTAVQAAALGNQEFVNRALEAADAINLQQEALTKAQNAAADRELIDSLQKELELTKLGNTEREVEIAQRKLTADATAAQKDEVAALVIELEKAKNAQADTEVIKSLEQELELSKMTNRERAIEIELRKLSATATDEQKAKVADLAGAVFDETERQKNSLEGLLGDFVGKADNLLAGALADPLGKGMEDLPAKFAQVLLQMSSQLLASEFFKLITGDGKGGGGGLLDGLLGAVGGAAGGGGGGGSGGGGIGSLIGLAANFLGFKDGGEFTVGGSGGPDSQLVQFMASPGENVAITKPGQQDQQQQQPVVVQSAPPQVIVVDDPSKVPAAMQSQAGESVVMDIIRNNRDAIRKEIS